MSYGEALEYIKTHDRPWFDWYLTNAAPHFPNAVTNYAAYLKEEEQSHD